MKVLIACEFSGIVRDAFLAKGHNAWSCDFLPTEKPGPHIQGDVLGILDKNWDMMIAHPPCTYLSYAGTSSWNNAGRCKQRLEALEFFRCLWEAPIGRICIENPKSCASPVIAKYTQEIQPFFFGDRQYKTMWLWLKNLPPLVHHEVDILWTERTHTAKPPPISIDNTPRNKRRYFVDAKTRNPKDRARFWPGIADAMAQQWGSHD